MEKFNYLHTNIQGLKPHHIIHTSDINAHSINWWPDGDSNNEGTQLDLLFNELGLTQLISEPTHFREHCHPSCIDLIISDQPNLVIESGVRPSLDPSCKHQITFCKLSISAPRFPPFKRLVWHYDKANRKLIEKAMLEFQWERSLNTSADPNAQVKLLNETILNIMKNFVPSSTVVSNGTEPEWITKDIKKMLKKQKNL